MNSADETIVTPEGRRSFIVAAGAGLTAIGFTSIMPATAASRHGKDAAAAQDINVMQVALALEHEGIAAYQIAGASGLLSPGVLKAAQIFLGHHQQHRDSLVALIGKAGGKPVASKPNEQYVQELDLGKLKTENDVLALALRLEQGAANAYIGQVAALKDKRLTHLFAQLGADEATHWTTLNSVLGNSIPERAFLFG